MRHERFDTGVVVSCSVFLSLRVWQTLKAPNARLRVSASGGDGYCQNPCELEAGAKVVFSALPSGSYGDTNITKYS